MKLPRELLVIMALLLTVAAGVQQSASQQESSIPALTSDSAAPGGGRALYLWLQSLGYGVERLEFRDYQPDDSTGVLFILAPSVQPKSNELAALRRWVEKGGTLIIVGDVPEAAPRLPVGSSAAQNNTTAAFLREFEFKFETLPEAKAESVPNQPLLLRPPVDRIRSESRGYVIGPARLVPVLGEPDRPVAGSLSVGKGKVYVLASTFAFSNEGIREADNAALLLNWLPAPAEARVVTFDEVHHGRTEPVSLFYRMVHEPWGWAILYVLCVLFLYLALDGRRFGRAVPKIIDTRRVAAEYVDSIANLLRRNGKGSWVAQHYEQNLRLELASVCGLDPSRSTAEVAERLGEMNKVVGNVTGKNARRVLLELQHGSQGRISEGNLVRLAAETVQILKECVRRR